jgi:hypothetical protein
MTFDRVGFEELNAEDAKSAEAIMRHAARIVCTGLPEEAGAAEVRSGSVTQRCVELTRTTFSGLHSHHVKTIEIGDGSLVLLGRDGRKLVFTEGSP